MSDTKTYTILSATLVFVGFLVSLKPWASLTIGGRGFLAIALGLYAGVITIGICSYFPRVFPATNTWAILEDLDRANELLIEWTTKKLVEFCDRNWRIASEKGFWIKVALILFVIATLFLCIAFCVSPVWSVSC